MIREQWEFVQQKSKKEVTRTEQNDQASSSSSNIGIERANLLPKVKPIEIIPKRPYHERTTFSRVIVNPIDNYI